MNKEHYESLIMSWVNGNRKWVWEEYLNLTPGGRFDFIDYINSNEVEDDVCKDICSTFLKNFLTD